MAKHYPFCTYLQGLGEGEVPQEHLGVQEEGEGHHWQVGREGEEEEEVGPFHG